MTIREELAALRDESYREFTARSIPSLEKDRILGVRTQPLRRLARELSGNADLQPVKEEFLQDLPHRLFEENQLHAMLLNEEKNFSVCITSVEAFLPYVDNWATCDQLVPAVFSAHRGELLPRIRLWMADSHPYTVRFGIGMLMRHFLEENFRPEYPEMVASVSSDEYYVNMMIAWYFATALAKQREAALPYFTERRLPEWTHREAIQKAVDSRRISPEDKAYLKTLR